MRFKVFATDYDGTLAHHGKADEATIAAVERVRVDSETNLRDILDKVHEISIDHIDDTHFFTLSQVYEDLLLKIEIIPHPGVDRDLAAAVERNPPRSVAAAESVVEELVGARAGWRRCAYARDADGHGVLRIELAEIPSLPGHIGNG